MKNYIFKLIKKKIKPKLVKSNLTQNVILNNKEMKYARKHPKKRFH